MTDKSMDDKSSSRGSKRRTKDNQLAILPLGGAGEIGMNIYLYGYGPETSRKWLMVDIGVTFPGPYEPGMELVFPDISFIEQERNNLVGIVLTHGHEDHFGTLIELWPRLRAPVYATPFTTALLRGKIAGYGSPEEFDITETPLGSRFKVGPFDLEYVSMSHSIPEPNALIIRAPEGTVCHSGDWKLDPEPMVGLPADEKRLREIGEEGVDVLLCDSTNVLKPGHSRSEGEVAKTLKRIIKEAKNRVVVTAFSSNVARIKSVALAAHAANREVVVAGRSLWRVIEAAKESGQLPEDLRFCSQDEYSHIDRSDMVLLCTGSQGESRAALGRIARGEHSKIKLARNDLVIFSSFTIPGNERTVSAMLNNLSDNGVDVITLSDDLVHASGHPQQEELRQLYGWLKPKALVPMHGEYRHLREHRKFGLENGIKSAALVTNGQVMRLLPGPLEIIDEVPTGRWYLDGSTVCMQHEEPLRERRKMSFVGLISASVLLDEEDYSLFDMSAEAHGVPQEVTAPDEPEDIILKAIKGTIVSLPKKKRRDEGAATEAVRRAIRAEFNRLWGKKPVVVVHLIYV